MSNKILVLGFYDKQNLGDEMFKEAIPKLFPNYDITFTSLDSIKRECNYNGEFKAIIIGGGDIVNNYFQKKIEWAIANFTGPVIALGIGIPYPDLIEKGYLDIYDHVFIREKTDVRRIQRRLGSKYAHYLPDMGFILDKPYFDFKQGKNIGVCLATALMNNMRQVDDICLFLEFLLQRDYRINLLKFNSSGSQKEDDTIINQYIYDKLSPEYENIVIDSYNYSTKQMLNVLSSMDYNICSRFHANIFSTLVGTPFLSIYSTRKVDLFIDDINHCDYAYKLLANEDIDVYNLIKKFYHLVSESNNVHKKLTDIQVEYQNLLHTRQPEIIINSSEKRIKPNMVPNIDSIDDIYEEIQRHIDTKSTYRDRGILDSDDATEIAKLISLSITNAPGDKYTYGTITNLIERPTELRGMIDWIIKDQLREEDEVGLRLNMTYINQENMRGLHRSGWQFCVDYLKSLQSDTGVICDLYMDRTFHWASSTLESTGMIPYTSPWIGLIHHAINSEYTEYNLDNLMSNPAFIQSLPICKGIFTLSTYLKKEVESRLKHYPTYDINVVSLFHPTQFIPLKDCFSADKFINNEDRMMINIGGWYRNTSTIYHIGVNKKPKQLPHPKCPCLNAGNQVEEDYPIRKAVLKGKNMNSYFPPEDFRIIGGYEEEEVYGRRTYYLKILDGSIDYVEGSIISGEPSSKGNRWIYYMEKYINENDLLVDNLGLSLDDVPYSFNFTLDDNIPTNKKYICNLQKYFREMINSVDIIEHLPNEDYDNLLSENVVFLDLVDCSAANTVIECIARNTPIIINRHPAVVEYLGEHYPLFYDDVDDIDSLLTVKNIKRAYFYLLTKSKDYLHIDYFIESLKNSVIYQNLNK